MSYHSNYHTSVHYSGSASYSYPASQNGGSGSVPYSGNVPVNVTINVNTQPFDGSVDKFSLSVDALGGSVAAMNVAQCLAIKKTADEVSASLINGFFGTISTELSQQLKALDSSIKASLGLIMEQGKAVTEKKDVMEGDYNRISSRYIKLFSDLDSECYKRIFALDKQSFNLSEKVQKQLLSETSGNAAALNLLGIEEESSTKTLAAISSMNRKTLDILKTLHGYIMQESTINSQLDSILTNEENHEIAQTYVPIIWSEIDMLEKSGAQSHECYIQDNIDQAGKQAITKKVDSFCTAASSVWEAVKDEEKEALNKEFNTLTELCFSGVSDETQQRIYKTMQSLWQNTELFSLERSVK